MPKAKIPASKNASGGVWRRWDCSALRTFEAIFGPFSPDGQRIITGSADQTAKVWEAATPQQVAAWEREEKVAAERLTLQRRE